MPRTLKKPVQGLEYVSMHITTAPGESRQSALTRAIEEGRLPCGRAGEIINWDIIPLYDVPCPCGDPNHWMLKWIDTPSTISHISGPVTTRR